MESDTPRTDAKDWMWTPAWAHPGQPLVEEERVVDAAFARELERELAAAIKQRDEARRKLCELSLFKKLVYRKVDGVDGRFDACKTPEEVAQVYEWDCFKEGGGAC
jgi:hypothetical protein